MDVSTSIRDILEKHEIRVCGTDQYRDQTYTTDLEFWSPLGEDMCISIEWDGTEKSFIDGFTSYASDFDPDEHAEMWIPYRGQNGTPSSIRALINDADAIDSFLEKVAIDLNAMEERNMREEKSNDD